MTVALNKTEILHRAHGFVKDYADARYEMGDAQNFIRGLCDVFGFSNKRLVSFEQRVQKLGGGRGRIDGFYPGKLLIEMKSRGEDLEKAYQQATDYLPGLKDAELPDSLRMPHSRAFGDGLFEVRPRGRSGIGRAFYCFLLGKRVVVLHAFIKKTQQTPDKELNLARKRLKELLHG